MLEKELLFKIEESTPLACRRYMRHVCTLQTDKQGAQLPLPVGDAPPTPIKDVKVKTVYSENPHPDRLHEMPVETCSSVDSDIGDERMEPKKYLNYEVYEPYCLVARSL